MVDNDKRTSLQCCCNMFYATGPMCRNMLKAVPTVPLHLVENHFADRHFVDTLNKIFVDQMFVSWLVDQTLRRLNACRLNVCRPNVCRLNVCRPNVFRPKDAEGKPIVWDICRVNFLSLFIHWRPLLGSHLLIEIKLLRPQWIPCRTKLQYLALSVTFTLV